MFLFQIMMCFLVANALNIYSFHKTDSELITDVSQHCENNYITSFYLLYGSPTTDSRIIFLRSVDYLVRNCSLLITGPDSQDKCKDKCVTVLVIEIFNYKKTNSSCSKMEGGIVIRSEGNQFADVCTDISRRSIKPEGQREIQSYLMVQRKFSIDVNFTNFSGTIKMTVTAAKNLGNYDNCSTDEVYCMLKDQVFCINKHLECDGNLNCGTPNLYDEYCSNLYVQEKILFALVYGVCLIAVVLFFFFKYCVSVYPLLPATSSSTTKKTNTTLF